MPTIAAKSKHHRTGRRLRLRFVGDNTPRLDAIEFHWSATAKGNPWTRVPDRTSEKSPSLDAKLPKALADFFVAFAAWSAGNRHASFSYSDQTNAKPIRNARESDKQHVHKVFVREDKQSCYKSILAGEGLSRMKKSRAKQRRAAKPEMPITLWVNQDVLPADCVEIFWDHCGAAALTDAAQLNELLLALRGKHEDKTVGGAPVKPMPPIPIPAFPTFFNDRTQQFKLRVEIDKQKHDVAELSLLALKLRRLVLLGRAGAGKTVASLRVLRSCSREMPTVFIGREGWIRDLGDTLLTIDSGQAIQDWRAALDVLLRGATTDVTADQIEAFAANGPVLLVVDSINGGSAPVATRVLDVLDEALRHLQSAAAVVTDRDATRYPAGGRWTIVNMITIEDEEIRSRVDEKYGAGTWDQIPDASRRLLSSPFFLDLALRGAELTSATRSEALAKFVASQARIDAASVTETMISTAAAYATGSRRLQLDALSKGTATALIESGIASPTDPAAKHMAFANDLFGDYFASLHLASKGVEWQPTGLDAISFSGERWKFEGLSYDNEGFDAITLAAEQIHSPVVGDSYLRAVYDWNWRAAVECLAVTHPLNGPFSPSARLVVLALLSERRLDPVDGTRHRAKRLLKDLPDQQAEELANAPEGAARSIIASYDFAVPWFAHWREVFCRNPNDEWTEDAADSICDADTLCGWTVSYVLKRAIIPEELCHRLRGIYRGLMIGATAEPNLQTSIRWRVVHSIAAGEGDAILNFLLSTLDKDPYPWVQWGAARSVIEFAARSTLPDLTERAINEMTDRAENLSESIAQEIAWVAQYHGAAPHFPRLVRPLLKTLRARASGEIARERWDERMKRFDGFWKETPYERQD